MFKKVVDFIRSLYHYQDGTIPLHAPVFLGNEKKYVNQCIDSTFVSSVGQFVDKFEKDIASYLNSKFAIACVNGTEALHISLILSGVKQDDEVITQPLTFIATANSIIYCGAFPLFVDVDKTTLGLSPEKLENFLQQNTIKKSDGYFYNKHTNRRIRACVPMHTFGHVSKIDEISTICKKYNLALIEDAAESLGSKYKGQHTGTFGNFGTLSFNGNKIITTGGGGMILTNDEYLAKKAKHITTQAKIPHQWNFEHDTIGYNYRMPNINAALGCAQLEQLDGFVKNKRETAQKYADFFNQTEIAFFNEPKNSTSNYWLNVILLKDKKERDKFLTYTNDNGVMTRPAWHLMTNLQIFKTCWVDTIENAQWLEDRIVNIPSSFRVTD